MFFRIVLGLLFSLISTLAIAQANLQNTSWVQVEALSSREAASRRAEDLSDKFENAAAFSVGSSWHGVVLGPYASRAEASKALQALRQAGSIPRDSFVTSYSAFRQQIWPPEGSVAIPVEAVAAVTTTVETETPKPEVESEAEAEAEPEIVIELPVEEPDETPQQARQSERKLSAQDKKDLQRALKWAGHYSGRIDGKYGKGTRRSMGKWQASRDYKATGVLTKRQRAALLTEYDEILDGLTFKTVSLDSAGIEIKVPEGLFSTEKFDAPFIRYEPSGAFDAKLILISQEADRDIMEVLYEVIKTLQIVPVTGNHRLTRDGFEIDGVSERWHTTGFAELQSGQLKGAILVWPANDKERRSRVELEIFRSFKRLTGVLDATAFAADDDAKVLSGLPVRQPKFVQTGVFVDSKGHVLTAQRGFESCGKIGVGQDAEMEFVATNGMAAVLRPVRGLSPLTVPVFQSAAPKTPSAVTVAGFSYGGLLGAPTLTFGQLRDLKDLSGDKTRARLDVETMEGDIGAPVFDRGGAILGVLLPVQEDSTRLLPATVKFAAFGANITDLLKEAKLKPQTTDTLAFMHPEDISGLARDSTVLVTCWD